MQAFEIVGWVVESEFWCAAHARIDAGDEDTGHATPVFASDEHDHTCRACLDDEIAERNAKRAKSRAVSPLGPRWEDIGSDVNWLDYGGLWARHLGGTEWHVIAFHNDGESEGRDRYAVTLSEVLTDDDRLDSARECCGYAADWRDDYGDPLPDSVKVAALHGYGARHEIGSYQGNNAHKLLRAARRAS